MSPRTTGGARPFARRLAALDGTRGVLVIVLLLYHFGVGRLTGAWLTLNVFFVLSGFLIVRLLVQERARTGRIDFLAFYARRARRLFPALAVLLAVVLVYGLTVATGSERGLLRGDVLATMGYFMNWRLIAQSNQYFVQFAPPSVLQHAWSLSVEEQFYLVIPVLLLALMALVRTRRALVLLLMVLALLSAGWMAYVGVVSDAARSHLYYGTDTRAQSLLVGAALGVWTASLGRTRRRNSLPVKQVQLIGWSALAVSLTGFVLATPQTTLMARGGMLALSFAAAAWVWAAADDRYGHFQRALAWAPLAALGRISYGAYLWHWPIGLWLARGIPGAPVAVRVMLGFAVTITVAAASYRWIETPIHDRGWRAVTGGVLRARSLAAAIALCLAAGAVAVGTGTPAVAGVTSRATGAVVLLKPGQHAFSAPAKPYTIALYGDSVPDLLVRNFTPDEFPGVHVAALAVPGCDLLDQPYVNPATGAVSPNHADCTEFKSTSAQRLARADSQLLIIFPSILLGFRHRFGDRDLWWGDPRYTAAVTAALDHITGEARRAGTQPAIVTQTCRDSASGGLGRFVDVAKVTDPAMVRELRTADRVNSFIRGWAAERHVPVADLDAALCPGGSPRQLPGIPVYADQIHLSAEITPSVWAYLIAELGEYRSGSR